MESKGALFRVAIPLIAFKIWFAILLLTYAPTRDTMVWIAATHWLLLLVIGLLVGPGIAVYRLLRARAKRKKLRLAEFSDATLTAKATRMRRRSIRSAVQCSALWETVSRLEGGDSARVDNR